MYVPEKKYAFTFYRIFDVRMQYSRELFVVLRLSQHTATQMVLRHDLLLSAAAAVAFDLRNSLSWFPYALSFSVLIFFFFNFMPFFHIGALVVPG